MSRFRNKGASQYAQLDAWEPSTQYRKEEQRANVDWSGPAPAAIGTKTRVPPPPPLEAIFGNLFKRIWVHAQPTPARPQGNFLAQTRAPRPGAPAPAPYQRMVAPTVLDPTVKPPAPRPLPAYPTLPSHPAPPRPGPLPPPPRSGPLPPPPAPAAVTNAHLEGVARDWDLHKGLQRFVGYAFRGDARDPGTIRSAGGFLPSSTRNDDAFIMKAVYEQFCSYMWRRFQKDLKATMSAQQFLDIVREVAKSPDDREAFSFYTTWRALVKSEELHLGRMLAQETLKSYISTTRAVTVAKGFAKSGGWVYSVAVNGGFVVPDKKASAWTQTFGEAEVAVANGIPWHAVAAARQMGTDGKFIGDLYVRNGFEKIDPPAFETIFKLMSGKLQA